MLLTTEARFFKKLTVDSIAEINYRLYNQNDAKSSREAENSLVDEAVKDHKLFATGKVLS